MSTSRRGFLKHAACGAFAAGVTATLSETSIARVVNSYPGAAVTTFGRADFESQVNSTFLIADGKLKARTQLIEVVDLGSNETGGKNREAFSLTFKGSARPALPQGTYNVQHQTLGSMTFLIVPVFAKDTTTRYYEVVVNRLHG